MKLQTVALRSAKPLPFAGSRRQIGSCSAGMVLFLGWLTAPIVGVSPAAMFILWPGG